MAYFIVVRGKIPSWLLFATVFLLLAAASWALYLVWRSPHRVNLATYGAFAVPVLALMVGWIAWAGRVWRRSGERATADGDLNRLADLLAVAVKIEWERAAHERGLMPEPIPIEWGRPSLPLAGPVAAATGSRRFTPLPGFAPLREGQLTAGRIDDLHTIYGGLRSGRLVIAGAPGAGKTSVAVLLVLAALRHRDQVGAADRVKVPVPMLLTAQDWDPRRQPLRDWLIARLQQGYPLFAGRSGAENAGRLIDAGNLTVIFDGLDEIAEDLRPIALQALNHVSFRVIVLSRTVEMAFAASQRGVLQGAAAVELRAVGPATAAGYLENIQLDPPPAGWRELIYRIRADPARPLAEALNNPLALTLIRDTYQSGDDARELLELCDRIQQRVSGLQAAEEITGHLLDRVLPAAYALRPGQRSPSYDLETAYNALSKIAAQMNKDGVRDLQWWQIPRWAPPVRRALLGGFVIWFMIGVIAFAAYFTYAVTHVDGVVKSILFGLGAGLLGGAIIGSVLGLIVGVATWVANYNSSSAPAKIGRVQRPQLRRIFLRQNLTLGLRAGLIFGPVIGLVFVIAELLISGIRDALVLGALMTLLAGLFFGIAFIIAFGLTESFVDSDSTSVPSPVISQRNDRKHSIVIGLMVGLTAGLMITLAVGVVVAITIGPAVGFGLGVQYGILLGLLAWVVAGIGVSRAWPTTLAAAQLARRWRTPLRLMKFLDDAHKRNVLRTVGPVYQFRHARLQDRLAAATTELTNTSRPTGIHSRH
jgi:hypothetical protein